MKTSKVKTNSKNLRSQYSKLSKIYDIEMYFWKLWGADDTRREIAVQALELRPDSKVLDLGCGTGLNFQFLREVVGPHGKIIGVDLTPEMLDEAQKKVKQYGWKNIELIEADANQYDFPNDLDGIISSFAMGIMPDHDILIERCAQALANGGRLVILDSKPTTGPLEFLNSIGVNLAKSLGVTIETIHWQP